MRPVVRRENTVWPNRIEHVPNDNVLEGDRLFWCHYICAEQEAHLEGLWRVTLFAMCVWFLKVLRAATTSAVVARCQSVYWVSVTVRITEYSLKRQASYYWSIRTPRSPYAIQNNRQCGRRIYCLWARHNGGRTLTPETDGRPDNVYSTFRQSFMTNGSTWRAT